MSSDGETFLQRCIRGAARPDEIDAAVEAWHRGEDARSLHDALGMTEGEYALWLNDPGTLTYIVAARRDGADLTRIIRETYYEPRLAVRSPASPEAKRVEAWLRQRDKVA